MAIGKTSASGIALAVLASAVAFASAPPMATAAQCRGADAQKLSSTRAEKTMLCLINKQRRNHGLRKLHRQPQQAKAASRHTKTMIRRRCFSHQCPGEKDLESRLEQVNYLPCRCSWGIAENIAYGSGGNGSPRSVFKAWMHSGDHRANILGGGYQHIGIGVATGSPVAGRDGGSTTYTADFGYRR